MINPNERIPETNERLLTKVSKVMPIQKWGFSIFTKYSQSVAAKDLQSGTFDAVSILKVSPKLSKFRYSEKTIRFEKNLPIFKYVTIFRQLYDWKIFFKFWISFAVHTYFILVQLQITEDKFQFESYTYDESYRVLKPRKETLI